MSVKLNEDSQPPDFSSEEEGVEVPDEYFYGDSA